MLKGYPYNGKPNLTQWKHDSKVNGQVLDQDALDLSPTPAMKVLRMTGIYLPREAKIIKVITKIPKQRDGYIVYMTRDGCEHYRVHCIFRTSLLLNKWYPTGTRIGTIDPRPVNATGSHDHHFIRKDGKVVDIIAWYKRRGITDWFRDPFHLVPSKS